MKKIPVMIMGILGVTLAATGCNNNQGAIIDRTPNQTGNYKTVGTNWESNTGFTRNNTDTVRNNMGSRDHRMGLRKGTDNSMNPTEIRNPVTNDAGNGYDYSRTKRTTPHFGFVSVNRSQLNSYAAHPMKYDRNALANTVTQSISDLPGIAEATVLVTDDHVYVGYIKDHTNSKRSTDDMVLKSAKSAVPTYYKVYVSSDRNLTRRVTQLVSTRTNYANIDEQLDQILGTR